MQLYLNVRSLIMQQLYIVFVMEIGKTTNSRYVVVFVKYGQ